MSWLRVRRTTLPLTVMTSSNGLVMMLNGWGLKITCE